MKKITLKDIAQRLGVTVGTVSHVLNGIDDISPDTRDRVLAAAKEMGYIPNISAASLRSGRSNTIAIIIPDISNPHIAFQIKLIEEKLKENNYTAIILNTDEDESAEYNAIVTACSRNVDGILICPSQRSRDNIRFLQTVEIPYVLIGRSFAEGDSDYVCADDEKGGRLAGEWLISKGCRKPVYIGAYKYIETSVQRFKGLCSAFSEVGVELTDKHFFETSPKGDLTRKAYEGLVASGVEFDSIVAFSDYIAFEIMTLVPRSVYVIGFDAVNTHLHIPCHHSSVGMTGNGWADTALQFLFDKIDGSDDSHRHLVDVKLYEF